MLIYGNRKACIATHHDYSQSCPKCKYFTVEYKVYREYIHLFWIPIFSSGGKTCVMLCSSCGFRNEYSNKSDSYIGITKTPLYLYSGLIVIVVSIFAICFANVNTQKEKKSFVDSPRVDDVYLIRNDSSYPAKYYFFKVNRIHTDSVFIFRNMYIYPGFVSELDNKDAFIRYEYSLSKNKLKTMLEKDEIVAVERDYDQQSNFNHIVLISSDSLIKEDADLDLK